MDQTAYLDLWELHNFRKDLDAVGVSDHSVHAPAVQDRGGDGFQFVPTDIDFLQFLQFCHFTKKEKIQGGGGHKVILRQLKRIHNENQRGIYYDFKDSLIIVILINDLSTIVFEYLKYFNTSFSTTKQKLLTLTLQIGNKKKNAHLFPLNCVCEGNNHLATQLSLNANENPTPTGQKLALIHYQCFKRAQFESMISLYGTENSRVCRGEQGYSS